MKKSTLFFILILLVHCGMAQHSESSAVVPNEHGLVKWLDFKEAQELYKKTPKPFLIDFYTDWCVWCKHMMKTTYSDPNIAGYINLYFYPIKFNAETKDTIEYNGEKYTSTDTSRKQSIHGLALKLLGSRQSYPSTLFVSNNFQFNFLSQGYVEAKEFEPMLIFTVENVYRNNSYDDFKANFKTAFYDTAKTIPLVKWYSMNEALQLQKTKPKKIIVDIYTSFCNSCKVMNKTTFSDKKLAEYINDKFYLVAFDAQSRDTVVVNGTPFFYSETSTFPFHSLALALSRDHLDLPTLTILNENLQIVDALSFYLSGKTIDPILHFFGDNAYKTMSWADYQKQLQEPKKTTE